MNEFLRQENEKFGADGLNAIQRRAQFMEMLDERQIIYEVGMRYFDTPEPYDSQAILRLMIILDDECTISALFSPNVVVGAYIETMTILPERVLRKYWSLDINDENGITKWHSNDNLLRYVLAIRRALKRCRTV